MLTPYLAFSKHSLTVRYVLVAVIRGKVAGGEILKDDILYEDILIPWRKMLYEINTLYCFH